MILYRTMEMNTGKQNRTHSAHEQSWKDRLIEDLLHDHRENLRAKDVGHRETDSNSYRNALENPSIITTTSTHTLNRAFDTDLLLRIMQQHHQFRGSKQLALPHARQVASYTSERLWRCRNDGPENAPHQLLRLLRSI